uniref:tRNA-5-taurinomethyluridine 2-sulfurtransferase n=1 Tax=Ditylenchus dipsaci TaxID=166011 RepID=A0A915DWY8_9BILA
MVNWDHQDEDDDPSCPRTKDLADAQDVCRKLDIEFHQVNFTKEYWNKVFLNFLENFKIGRTVLADADCNRCIKFDMLHKYAVDKLSADYIATGHFARTAIADNGLVKLLKSRDPLKDQTYFLSKLSQSQLRRSLFPVGGMIKPEVKQIAINVGLEKTASRQESMGICFVGKKKLFSEFLDKYIEPVTHGRFVDAESGETFEDLSHTGIHNFTIGKRIRLASMISCTSVENDGLYVSGTNFATQTVYLCRGSHHPSLFTRTFLISLPYWISEDSWQTDRLLGRDWCSLRFCLQRTYQPVQCRLSRCPSGSPYLLVESRLPIRAVSPGQLCAFYSGDECLGSAEVECVQETLMGPVKNGQ